MFLAHRFVRAPPILPARQKHIRLKMPRRVAGVLPKAAAASGSSERASPESPVYVQDVDFWDAVTEVIRSFHWFGWKPAWFGWWPSWWISWWCRWIVLVQCSEWHWSAVWSCWEGRCPTSIEAQDPRTEGWWAFAECYWEKTLVWLYQWWQVHPLSRMPSTLSPWCSGDTWNGLPWVRDYAWTGRRNLHWVRLHRPCGQGLSFGGQGLAIQGYKAVFDVSQESALPDLLWPHCWGGVDLRPGVNLEWRLRTSPMIWWTNQSTQVAYGFSILVAMENNLYEHLCAFSMLWVRWCISVIFFSACYLIVRVADLCNWLRPNSCMQFWFWNRVSGVRLQTQVCNTLLNAIPGIGVEGKNKLFLVSFDSTLGIPICSWRCAEPLRLSLTGTTVTKWMVFFLQVMQVCNFEFVFGNLREESLVVLFFQRGTNECFWRSSVDRWMICQSFMGLYVRLLEATLHFWNCTWKFLEEIRFY